MKKSLWVILLLTVFACNPDTGESGAVDDGIKAVDSNGALQDTARVQPHPGIDSTKAEDRVDIQQRDTSNK
ncbi:MAG: hypothetical protein ABR502_03060 [Chitinophagaceae bacterium]